MPNTTTNTSNRAYPLPTAGNDLAYDVAKIITAFTAIDADVATAFAQIAAKAGLASPAFSGTPTAPTAAPGTNTGQLATTAFVAATVNALVNAAPGTLDTLSELATALGNDANFAATMTTALAGKVPFSIIDTDTTMAANSDAKLASQKAVKAYIDAIAAAKASLTGAETLTNKTLTSPVLNTPSLILKQSANPTPTAEGDMQWDTDDDYIKIGNGSATKVFKPNNWETIGEYTPSNVASLTITNLGTYRMLRLSGHLTPLSNAFIAFRVSDDNGATWKQGASDYGYAYLYPVSGAANAGQATYASGLISGSGLANIPTTISALFSCWNKAGVSKGVTSIAGNVNSAGQEAVWGSSNRCISTGFPALNALMLFASSGNITGELTLEGLK